MTVFPPRSQHNNIKTSLCRSASPPNAGMLPLWLAAASLACISLMGCNGPPQSHPSETSTAPPFSQIEAPIVGGQPEPGFAAVGAMTLLTAQFGYTGSFCSGTLVHPEWVLTAAHCLTGEGGFAGYIEPANVRFYIGANATPASFGQPPAQGRLVQTLAFYIHPKYLGQSSDDVALVRLSEPVADVAPIPFHDGIFGSAFTGATFTYVGFGVSDGDKQTGGGIKRRAEMDVALVESSTYTNQFKGQGVCFGDSGGPGLYLYEGEWRVMGVNSAVAGSQGTDPCTEYTIHTRIDVHASWATEIIANPPPIVGCLLDKSFCSCPDACQADGGCDETRCPPLGSCEGLSLCLSACTKPECKENCEGRATNLAKQSYTQMVGCLQENCSGLGGFQYNGCAFGTCGTALVQCLEPNGSSGKTCSEILDCVKGCSGQQGCNGQCQSGASIKGRTEYTKLRQCGQANCPGMQNGSAPYLACLGTQCADLLAECNNDETPAPCNPLAPECDEGLACIPGPTGEGLCRSTFGWTEGTACHPPLPDGPECDAGLACATLTEGESTCEPICGADGECTGGRICDLDALAAGASVGACRCVDEDGDGICSLSDCDDSDASALPGAPEVCGDGIDNNCDGHVDEDCDAEGSDEGGSGESATEPGETTDSAQPNESSGGCNHRGTAPTLPLGWGLVVAAGLLIRRRRA